MFWLLLFQTAVGTSAEPSVLPLTFPVLNPDTPGSLRTTIPDIDGNLLSTGVSSSNSFIAKRDSHNRLIWQITYQNRVLPSLAYSPRNGLFVLVADNSAQGKADLFLVKLEESSGNMMTRAFVERVRVPTEHTMRVVLASTENRKNAFAYVAYLVQDDVNPSVSKTKVIRWKDADTGLQRTWDRIVTFSKSHARWVSAVENMEEGNVLIAEVARNSSMDMLAVHVVDEDGLAKSVAKQVERNAALSAFTNDDSGAMYVGLRPFQLHKLVIADTPGQSFLSPEWSVYADIIDVESLRNGTALYVLSEEEGFRVEKGRTVPASVPVLSMFNASGGLMMKSRHEERVPDIEHVYFSVSLLDVERSGNAVLSGFVRVGEAQSQAAMALLEFPHVGKEQGGQLTFAPPSDDDDGIDGGQTGLFIGIGVGAGIVAVAVIVGMALFMSHRSEKDTVTIVEEPEEMPPTPLPKSYRVLV